MKLHCCRMASWHPTETNELWVFVLAIAVVINIQPNFPSFGAQIHVDCTALPASHVSVIVVTCLVFFATLSVLSPSVRQKSGEILVCPNFAVSRP
jgi:hypothetical protein